MHLGDEAATQIELRIVLKMETAVFLCGGEQYKPHKAKPSLVHHQSHDGIGFYARTEDGHN